MTSPKSTQDELTIGQLAARFGLATHVLRHWETMGVIAPAERVGGRRRYRDSHVTRVALIVLGKQTGLTLRQIGQVLDAADGSRRKELLRRHHVDLGRRIAQMEASRALIEGCLSCPAPDFIQCPHCQRHLRELEVQDAGDERGASN